MNYAAILAGGNGTRMHSSVPKQFLDIDGIPIVIHTIRKICSSLLFDKIIVAVLPEWEEKLIHYVQKYELTKYNISLIYGGRKRLDSIHNVLIYIKNFFGINLDDKIVIHDAVRPFISKKILKENLLKLDSFDAVVTALPVVDTMLWIENGKTVSDMPTRSKLFHGQTPDSFRLSVLEKKIITGTAQICMLKGIPVATIPGDPINIKITTPFDLKLANLFCTLEN